MADAVAPLVGERRLPRKALLIALAGALGSGAIAAYGLLHGLNALPTSIQVFCVLLLLMLLGQLPTLCSYAFGPRQLAFGEQAMVLDGVSYPYDQMTGIVCDASSEATRITLAKGPRQLLRWDIWINDEDWNALLLERTFPHLYAQAKATLARGGKIEFGKGVALDREALHFPKDSLPLRAIVEIRFASENDQGVHVRTLHVASAERQLSINENRLSNQHVLFALLQDMLPRPA